MRYGKGERSYILYRTGLLTLRTHVWYRHRGMLLNPTVFNRHLDAELGTPGKDAA